jgi:hypothetical protein
MERALGPSLRSRAMVELTSLPKLTAPATPTALEEPVSSAAVAFP